jgi:hypothetical protein
VIPESILEAEHRVAHHRAPLVPSEGAQRWVARDSLRELTAFAIARVRCILRLIRPGGAGSDKGDHSRPSVLAPGGR